MVGRASVKQRFDPERVPRCNQLLCARVPAHECKIAQQPRNDVWSAAIDCQEYQFEIGHIFTRFGKSADLGAVIKSNVTYSPQRPLLPHQRPESVTACISERRKRARAAAFPFPLFRQTREIAE